MMNCMCSFEDPNLVELKLKAPNAPSFPYVMHHFGPVLNVYFSSDKINIQKKYCILVMLGNIYLLKDQY